MTQRVTGVGTWRNLLTGAAGNGDILLNALDVAVISTAKPAGS